MYQTFMAIFCLFFKLLCSISQDGYTLIHLTACLLMDICVCKCIEIHEHQTESSGYFWGIK